MTLTLRALEATNVLVVCIVWTLSIIPLEYVIFHVLRHTRVTDLAADRSGSCRMCVEMYNLVTKPSSWDIILVPILDISTLSIHIFGITSFWFDSGLKPRIHILKHMMA